MTAPPGPAACDFCGLPLPRPWRHAAGPAPGLTLSPSGRGQGEGGHYCCFGCRFAADVTRAHGDEGAAAWNLIRLGAAVFLTMNVVVFTMALWSQDLYGGGEGPAVLPSLFRWLAMLFALPVLFILGGPLLDNALHDLWRGRPGTDLLLVLGVAAAYLYSAVSVLRDGGPVYFEVGCVVLVLVTLGRWMEAQGKLRATAAIDALQRLLPPTVRATRNGAEITLPLDDVRTGDRLRVLAGERIPCDGRVEVFPAAVDEQFLTGESRPVAKEPGDPVFAGCLNLDAELGLAVTATGAESALGRVIDLVRRARLRTGYYERLADRASAVFLPAVVLVAVAAAGWHGYRQGPGAGVLTGLAVLLIACPCALGLATPMAVWAALGRAAQEQVLFRSCEALERLATVRVIRLDKTGTLTTGTPVVASFHAGPEEETALAVAGRLAAASTHGYSRAICRFVGPGTGETAGRPLQGIKVLAGRGVVADLSNGDGRACLGSVRLMEETRFAWPAALAAARDAAEKAGSPVSCVAWGGKVRGLFAFREELRPGTVAGITQIRGHGMELAVLTGDGSAGAGLLAAELGLPVISNLLPEDKVTMIAAARDGFGPVAMVGDGINDAPALTAADVGVALGCGTDVARDSAAVCLLNDDLSRFAWAVALARRTVRVVRQNLFWAFAYNGVGIGLACTGRLNPVWAALAMVLSGLLVVGNSLRLQRAAPGEHAP